MSKLNIYQKIKWFLFMVIMDVIGMAVLALICSAISSATNSGSSITFNYARIFYLCFAYFGGAGILFAFNEMFTIINDENSGNDEAFVFSVAIYYLTFGLNALMKEIIIGWEELTKFWQLTICFAIVYIAIRKLFISIYGLNKKND